MPPDDPDIRSLQESIERTKLRRAADLTMAEKLRLGADLHDDGIRWLRRILRAEQPDLTDEQVELELDRRRAIQKRIEAAEFARSRAKETPIGDD